MLMLRRPMGSAFNIGDDKISVTAIDWDPEIPGCYIRVGRSPEYVKLGGTVTLGPSMFVLTRVEWRQDGKQVAEFACSAPAYIPIRRCELISLPQAHAV